MRRGGAVALLVLAAGVTTGCGGGHDEATTTRAGVPVNERQTLVLAQLLEANWQRRGAVLDGEFAIRGVSVRMRARVDFRSGRGTMLIRQVGAAGVPPRRVTWSRTRVFAQRAPGSSDYVEQRPDPQGDPIHRVIAFVNLLSAETIDNTANIRDQGTVFVETTTIDGRPADVYRYGRPSITTYWVDRRDALLRRVVAEVGENDRIAVSFVERGAQRIEEPVSERPNGGVQ